MLKRSQTYTRLVMSVETRSIGTSIGRGTSASVASRPAMGAMRSSTPGMERGTSRGSEKMTGFSISSTGKISRVSNESVLAKAQRTTQASEKKSSFTNLRPLTVSREFSKDTHKPHTPIKGMQVLYQRSPVKTESPKSAVVSQVEQKSKTLPSKLIPQTNRLPENTRVVKIAQPDVQGRVGNRQIITTPSLEAKTSPKAERPRFSLDTVKPSINMRETKALYQKPATVEQPQQINKTEVRPFPVVPNRIARLEQTRQALRELPKVRQHESTQKVTALTPQIRKNEHVRLSVTSWTEKQKVLAQKRKAITAKNMNVSAKTQPEESKVNTVRSAFEQRVRQKNALPQKIEKVTAPTPKLVRKDIAFVTTASQKQSVETHAVQRLTHEVIRMPQIQQEIKVSTQTKSTELKLEHVRREITAIMQQGIVTITKYDAVQQPQAREMVTQMIRETVIRRGLVSYMPRYQSNESRSTTRATQTAASPEVAQPKSAQVADLERNASGAATKTEQSTQKKTAVNLQTATRTEQTYYAAQAQLDEMTQSGHIHSGRVMNKNGQTVIEKEEFVTERDTVADAHRVAAATQAGVQALTQAEQNGHNEVAASDIVALLPSKPLGGLVSMIREQLKLSLDTEKQYDFFKAAIKNTYRRLTSVRDIHDAAVAATNDAPAVRLNTRITTEIVKPVDEIRAVSDGQGSLAAA